MQIEGSGPRSVDGTEAAGRSIGPKLASSGRARITLFLIIAAGIALVSGLVLASLGIAPNTPLFLAVVGVLYMPSPAIAAIIVRRLAANHEPIATPWRVARGDRRRFVNISIGVIVALTLSMVLLFVIADWVGVPGAGELARTEDDVLSAVAELLGEDDIDQAQVDTPAVLLVTALGIGIAAGFTVNGLFALGEEWGWRGFLLPELRALGVQRIDLAVGIPWGLWHAPLIVQGWNFPSDPVVGIAVMTVATVAMSRVLRLAVDGSGTVLTAAVIHGGFNAVGGALVSLMVGGSLLANSPVGLIGALGAALAGVVLDALLRPQPSDTGAVTC